MKYKVAIKTFFLGLLPYVHLIGSFSSIIGLLLVIYKPELVESNYLVTVICTFTLIISIFVVDSFFLRKTNLRLKSENNRYKKSKNAYNKVSMGLAKINLADRLNHEASISERKQTVKSFLNELSSAYTILCGYPCATTIKIHIESEGKDFLQTLCRDSNVGGRNHQSTEASKQYIDKNTSFEYLYQNLHSPAGRYFIENNLPLRRGYKNPSFELYSNFTYKGIPDDWKDKDRIKVWKLPFRSTIIVPILPHPDLEEELLDYKGFLTVDCDEIDVFDEVYDVELLINAADCLYNFINDFMKVLLEELAKENKREAG